jgi:hypothetical protein
MVSTLQKDTYNDEELGLLSDILTVCRETSRKMSNGVFAVFLRLQTLHHCQHGGGWVRGEGGLQSRDSNEVAAGSGPMSEQWAQCTDVPPMGEQCLQS